MPKTLPVLFNDVYEDAYNFLMTGLRERPTFQIFEKDVPVVQDSAFVLWNDSDMILKLTKLKFGNVLTSLNSGSPVKIAHKKVTAVSGGTQLQIVARDSEDALPSGVTAVRDPASVTYGVDLGRLMIYPAVDPSSYSGQRVPTVEEKLHEVSAGAKGLVIRNGEGFALVIENSLDSTAFDFCVEIVVEANL